MDQIHNSIVTVVKTAVNLNRVEQLLILSQREMTVIRAYC